MSSFHSSRWISFLLCAVFAATGCASDSSSPDGSTGSLSLDLTIAGGFMIDEVMWTISGGDMEDMTGVVDTSAPGSTASVEVFGIPAGTGYVIELEATSTDDEVSCEGSASFDVQAGVSTPVEVMLNCKRTQTLGGVRVNGELNICAELSKVVVSPLQTSVGNDIDLSSQAVDQEGDPIAYLWTSNSGMIADSAAANTTYTCTEAIDDEVTVMVTDDGGEHCMSAWTILVTCVTSGGGTGGEGGAGGAAGEGGAGGAAGEGGAGGAGGAAGEGGAGGAAGEGGAGGAQPVDYDEAVDGDLEFVEGVGYTVTVTVAPGTNTVSGVFGFDGTNADIDPFFLIVPDGHQIESIEFDYTTTIFANPGYAGYTLYLDAVSGGATIGDERVEATEVPSESREFYADLVPLGPGRYALGRPGGSRKADMIFEVAYTWTIVVSCSMCSSSSPTTFP